MPFSRAPVDERDGIPIFAPASGADFERHWKAAGPLAEAKLTAARTFLRPLLEQSRPGDRVFDGGCGDGVHSSVLASGGIVGMGVDVSVAALRRARAHVPSWTFVQASLLDLPFADGAFDAAFSYGVVAYTPEPAKAVAELVRVVRPSGLVGIWCAPPHGGLRGAAFGAVRAVATRGGPRVATAMATAIAPLLGLLPRASGVTWRNAGFRAAREVVLVNIAPRALIFPSREDVVTWIDDAGADIVVELDDPVGVWARRR